MPSVQRETRRSDQQLYFPGRGLLSKGSKPVVVPVAEKKSDLISVTSKQVNSVCCEDFTGASTIKRNLKIRRPDIQLYVPKAKLLGSQVNKSSHSSLNSFSKREEESQEIKKSSSHCNSQNSSGVKPKQYLKIEETFVGNNQQCVEFPPQKSKSWADQVEEYSSNAIQLNEELVGKSFDNNQVSILETDQVKKCSSNAIHLNEEMVEESFNPTQISISWADQVEEYSSNAIQLNEELVGKSFDMDKSGKNNLGNYIDPLESDYSSGYSSCNEDLQFVKNETYECNKTDSFHGILKQKDSELNFLVQGKHDIEEVVKSESSVCDERVALLEKLLSGDKPIKIKKSLLAQILPREAPIFPVRVEDEVKMREREEILERQIAFFDKLAAKTKSKEKMSASLVPPAAPPIPGRASETFQKTFENGEHVVEKKISMPDGKLVNPETGERLDSNIFQRLEIPKISGNSKSRVSDQGPPLNVPCTELDHILCAPEDFNSHNSPITLDTDSYTNVSLPISVQYSKFEHPFCALENLNLYHSPVTLNANLCTELSIPFNGPSTKMDNSFCASECSYSYGSVVPFGADMYIPPPLPFNRPHSKLDYTFPALECQNSYLSSFDELYIPAPRPRL